jgi:hypothetical protein
LGGTKQHSVVGVGGRGRGSQPSADGGSALGAPAGTAAGPAGGATFALPLTLTGRSRVSVSVSLGAAAAGDTLPPPRVLVRDAAGVFRPLAPGGPPVLVVDRAQPNGSTRVDVQGWVERSPAGADPKRLPLLYTVWYPDSP